MGQSLRPLWLAQTVLLLLLVFHACAYVDKSVRRRVKQTKTKDIYQTVQKFDICPTDLCRCNYDDGSVKVICTRSLEEVPQFVVPPGLNYESIEFGDTALTSIKDDAFKNLEVPVLYFHGNNFSQGLSAHAFRGLEDVAWAVAFSNCQLRSVDTVKPILPLRKLHVLILEDNNITEIPRHSFYGLEQLAQLSLSRNQIRVIGRHALAGLPNLHVLKLSNNHITDLPKHSFRKLAALNTLDLSQNEIHVIQRGTFRGLNSLVTLKLSGNQLTRLDLRSLKGLSNLQYLNLMGNPLSVIQDGVFGCTKRLNYLALDVPDLGKITAKTFSHLKKLHTLNMDGDVSRKTLPEGVFGDMRNLKHISFLNHGGDFLGLEPKYFHRKLNYDKLQVFTQPLCKCGETWVKTLTEKGVSLKGYCEIAPVTCVKEIKMPKDIMRVPTFNFKRILDPNWKKKHSDKKADDTKNKIASKKNKRRRNRFVNPFKDNLSRSNRGRKRTTPSPTHAPLMSTPMPALSRRISHDVDAKVKVKDEVAAKENPATIFHISGVEYG